jgi:ABC-type antimicrobial peptide transport system permease subunit
MFKNFFKIAGRNLWRSKSFSAINIIGLAIGMASAMIILLWIQNELSYDQFHEKKERIYQAWNQASFNGKLSSWNTTPKILARSLEKDLPEVEQATRVNWNNKWVFTIGNKELFAEGNQVDSNFLQMFSFPLVKGNPTTVLKSMYSIVLTEKLAKRLFGTEDVVGKIIKINDQGNFTVTGILKDLPNNTRFDFEWLIPWSFLRSKDIDENNWGRNNTSTYVLLKPAASLASVQAKLKSYKERYDPGTKNYNWEMFLYPISRWRLYGDFQNGKETGAGRISFVRLFAVIAAFILLIACINFMNLSTARSEKRAKEVGIRKVVGALKGSLICQFIGESVLLALIAGMIATVIVQVCLPAFNQLTDKNLFIPFNSLSFWAAGTGFVILTGFLAGSYPAFYLSSFRPVEVLKGKIQKAGALITPRKVLVVLQFTFAIILIICTVVVKQQIDFAKDRQTGYDKKSLIYSFLSPDINKNYSLLKNDLLQSGTAVSVTKTSAPLTQDWNSTGDVQWEGKDPNDQTGFRQFNEDGGLEKTAGVEFIAGRDIDPDKYPTDSSAMILNESALKVMKFNNPLGQIIKTGDKTWHVVGVIRDFILESPYEPVKPMFIVGPNSWFEVVLIKLNDKNKMAQNLEATAAIFKKYSPNYLFVNNFVDEDYGAKFKDEERTGILASLFAGLTIFISCLGLFGLATYMVEIRIREIGVRKVLGGTVFNIATLLSKDFVQLIIIAALIATPVAWTVMHKWLDGYSYRVNIGWMVFAISGLLATFIALATVSFQAVRAAMANPVKSLRQE